MPYWWIYLKRVGRIIPPLSSALESINIMLETKSAFPDLNDINAPEMICKSCNSEMEFDGIEKKYFIFLKRQAN